MISKIRSVIQNLLPHNAFARGVSLLIGGTAGAQVLLVLASPLLTRLYSPEDFGVLAVYASLLALIGIASSLRYELAIPLPKDDQEAANVAILSLALVGISSILTGLLALFAGESIAQALNTPALVDYLWLLPVGVLLSGTYTIFNNWGIRAKQFGVIATTKLRQAFATLAIQFAAFKLGGIALLLGQVAGQSAGTASLAIPTLAKQEFRSLRLKDIKRVAVRYRQFPKFSIWSGLVNVAGHQMPPVVFAAFFATHAAGLYALANRVLALPASLIGSAIAQVFFSHAAESHRENKLGEMYLKLLETLIQIGLLPMLILVLAGPDLFALIFGETWREAGVFSQWLAIGVFAEFVASPLSLVFAILEKQRVGLLLQLTLFSARFIAIAIGVWQSSLILAIVLFSLASLFGYFLYLMISTKHAGCNLKNAAGLISKSMLSSFVVAAPLLIASFSQSKVVFIIALIVTGCATSIRLTVIAKNLF